MIVIKLNKEIILSKDNIQIPAEVWVQVEKKARECKVAWGMGFPVISITLLKQILKREEVNQPSKSINKE